MPNYKFEHIHLISNDPEKTAEFYIKHLGAKQVSVMTLPGGLKGVRLTLNDQLIIISPPRVKPPILGLEHFGLTTDDMTASIAELKAVGCKIRDEPIEMSPGTRIAFFWTPEGVLIELVEKKK